MSVPEICSSEPCGARLLTNFQGVSPAERSESGAGAEEQRSGTHAGRHWPLGQDDPRAGREAFHYRPDTHNPTKEHGRPKQGAAESRKGRRGGARERLKAAAGRYIAHCRQRATARCRPKRGRAAVSAAADAQAAALQSGGAPHATAGLTCCICG